MVVNSATVPLQFVFPSMLRRLAEAGERGQQTFRRPRIVMLKFLSGRKRSRNLFLIFFVLVMTLSLVGLFSVAVSGGASGLFGTKAGGNDTTIAKVGSYDVTLKEFKD